VANRIHPFGAKMLIAGTQLLQVGRYDQSGNPGQFSVRTGWTGMKILIDNGEPQFSNLGDLALLLSAYSALKAEWPEAEIFTLALKPERLLEVLPDAKPVNPYDRSRWSGVMAVGWLAEGYSPFFRSSARLFRNFVSGRLISRLIDLAPGECRSKQLEFAKFARFLEEIDLYVWAGGGYLADHFGSLATQFANTLEYLAGKGVPSIAFGLGIGPLNRRRIAAAVKGTMSNLSYIGLRDGLSSQLLQEWSFPENKFCVTGDDAIALASPCRPAELGQSLGISLRATYYSGLSETHFRRIADVVGVFCSKHGVGLASIPIARQDLGTNRSITNDVLQFTEPEFTIEAVLKNVASCRAVVTGSYHAAVFALSMGVSVVAIAATDYYRQKFAGLKEQFGGLLQILSFDASSELSMFAETLASLVEDAWRDAPNRRAALIQKAEEQVARGRVFRKMAFEHLRMRLPRKFAESGGSCDAVPPAPARSGETATV
jgi:polysaccharide pyruvyl transferase WcaK-like protein